MVAIKTFFVPDEALENMQIEGIAVCYRINYSACAELIIAYILRVDYS